MIRSSTRVMRGFSRILAVLGISAAAASPSLAQETPGSTLVTRFAADGATAEQLALSVTNSLELTLRLAGVPNVERADYLMPEVSLSATTGFYARAEARRAVFGAIQPRQAGGYVIQAGVWSAETDEVSELTAEIDSVFGIFDLADDLALDIAAEVVGRDLAFATIEIENTEHLGAIAVYVDGQLVARDETEIQILAGSRTVTVARPGPLGDQPFEEFNLALEAGQTHRIALEPPPETVAEAGAEDEAAEPKSSGAGLLRQSATEETETGSLLVETSPPGATVLLDGERIGTTPLEAFGVETGRYELALERPMFRPTIAAVDVLAGQPATLSQPLELDLEHPEVAVRLITPAAPSIASLTTTAMKAAYITWIFTSGHPWRWTSVFTGDPPFAAMDLAAVGMLHAGSLLAHDPTVGILLSLGNAVLLAGPPVVATLTSEITGRDITQNSLYTGVAGTAAYLGSAAFALYDLAFTPAAAQRRNERLTGRIQETGEIPEATSAPRRRLMIGAGNGAVGRVGYVQEIFRPFGRIEAAVGTGLGGSDPVVATPVASVRLAARPFAHHTPGVHPELSGLIQAETDLQDYGMSAGFAFGSVLSFRRFELFWRSNYLYGLRTKRQSYLSSFGISL